MRLERLEEPAAGTLVPVGVDRVRPAAGTGRRLALPSSALEAQDGAETSCSGPAPELASRDVPRGRATPTALFVVPSSPSHSYGDRVGGCQHQVRRRMVPKMDGMIVDNRTARAGAGPAGSEPGGSGRHHDLQSTTEIPHSVLDSDRDGIPRRGHRGPHRHLWNRGFADMWSCPRRCSSESRRRTRHRACAAPPRRPGHLSRRSSSSTTTPRPRAWTVCADRTDGPSSASPARGVGEQVTGRVWSFPVTSPRSAAATRSCARET